MRGCLHCEADQSYLIECRDGAHAFLVATEGIRKERDMHLYNLTETYARLLDTVDDEESDDALIQLVLGDSTDDILAKVENTAKAIRILEGEAAAARAEAERLAKRAKARENRVDWLKNYIKSNLEAVNLDKLVAGLFTVAIQNNSTPTVNYPDLDAIPEAWRIYPPPTWRPDTRAIVQLWRDGQTVPGTEVIVGRHLRIR